MSEEQPKDPKLVLDKAWERTQKKTFTAWVNSHLRKVGTSIAEIGTDFSDGIKLSQLLEIIADDKVEKLNRKPTMRIHMIQNTGQCLKFISAKGVKLVGIGPEELVDGNLKMVLGMIWTIILRFQIQDISIEEMSAKEGLLLWCQRKTEGYPHVKVSNFHTSFQDGLALCALIHRHRPDLLDFHKLDPSDKAGNLQLAFDVAANKLDIPKMLDVGDMLDVVRPDERSVMTYVAAYFHVFSASQKAETAAQRVAKILEFTEANNAAKTDYVERAQRLTDWLNETIARLEDRDFGSTIEDIQNHLASFKDYKTQEKPPKGKDLLSLEAAFNSLQTKLRLNNRPAFVPPEGLSPHDLDALWLRLEKTEQDRAEALRNALRRQRKIDYLLQKFNLKLRKLGEWVNTEGALLQNSAVGQTITVVQAQIKNQETFEEEYTAVGHTFTADTNDILSKLTDLGYGDVPTLVERQQALLSGAFHELKGISDARKGLLLQQLQHLQQIESLLLDFAKRSAQLNVWMETSDEMLSDPIVVESVQAVDELQNVLDSFSQDLSQKTAEFQSLGELAHQLASLNASENTYSRLSMADLTNRWNAFQQLIVTRQDKLNSVKSAQQANEVLRVEFAEKAAAFVAWTKEENTRVSSVTSSGRPLDQQLASAGENVANIFNNQQRFDEMVNLAQKIEDAQITDNQHTELTIEVLKLKWEKLTTHARETHDAIQKQILSKENSEASPEELKELRECFDHFDKDHDGSLTRLELDACLKSLGEDLKEPQLNQLMQEIGGAAGAVPFEEFVNFMIRQRKGSDSPDSIKNSFRIMANGNDYITEGQLRSVLPAQRVEYLLANMPAYPGVEGAFDYSKFTDELYTL